MKKWLFTLFYFIPSIALAAPSITSVSGTVADGNSITVTGSGFGSNGPKIILFDDFGRGSAGEAFSSDATVGTWSSMRGYVWTDSALSKGRGARLITPNGHVNNNKLFNGEYSEVFVSSRAYVPNGYRFPMADADKKMPKISALKHHWVYYGNYGYAAGKGHDIFGPNWTGTAWHTTTTNENKDYVYQQWKNPGWEWGKPVRWSHWWKGDPNNNPHNTKGYFQGITSTQQVISKWDSGNMDGKTWLSQSYESEGMPYAWDRLSIVGYFRSGSSYPQHNYVIDDVYLAVGPNSAARVEIGNKSDYQTCTKMAISTPTSWSNTKINVTIREGNFNPGEKAYLFIVDANNSPSAGRAVTFGGTSTSSSTTSSQPPPAPGKPFVVN